MGVDGIKSEIENTIYVKMICSAGKEGNHSAKRGSNNAAEVEAEAVKDQYGGVRL
jgi:hypothetical protein